MATKRNGDLPVPDLRTMEELCQPSLNGLGGPNAPIIIQATSFGLKNDMIQQSIKVNGVTDDALRLYLFLHSLTHHATAWFDRLPWNSVNTFEQMAKMFLGKYFPHSMVMKLRNEITNFRQRPDESLFEAWERYNLSIDRCGTFMKRRPEECYNLIENTTAHHNDWDTSVNQQVKAVTPSCETCGGPHSFNDCPATIGQTQNVYVARAYQGNTITNPKEELKGITARSGTEYQGPTIPTTSSSPPTETLILNPEPVVAPIIEPVAAPVSAPKPNQKLSIPYPSRLHDQKLHDKDFDADPRVPLILGRSFLNTGRALIDVFEGELTLRVGREAITFNLDQISRYSANYNDMTAKRIDVVDMACEEYLQEVLSFSDVIASGNPTAYYDPIVSTTSPTLTPFGNSDFLLEEVDAFLALEDDATSPKVDQSYFNPERNILLLEAFLNDDPLLPPLTQGNYLP
uniref:Reverse transcriptase domain-containing protein n=1 Tax=Tanacetum cinerariifolium TaxID=118510 RepID=A0A6L2MKH5_TANCI|nr:reverse transcriptase domain-containing protein [Tanacetum cinerariifolium]